MEQAVDLATYANAVTFTVLTAVAGIRWARQPSEANKWVTATFACLAAVGIFGILTLNESSDLAPKFALALLASVPYCLYRFMGTFLDHPLWLRVLAGMLTAGVIAWTFLLPPLPETAGGLTPVHRYYFLVFVIQFALLSLLVTVRLWVAGRRQPIVTRARMRILSIGTFGITAAVVLALSVAYATTVDRAVELTCLVISLISMVGFFVGFAPPAWLGALWRRNEVARERATLFHSLAQARGELEELNAALTRRESMLAQAQDLSQIGSWEWDISSDVFEWSAQLYRIYGVDPVGFTPSFGRFLALVHPEDRGYVESIFTQAIRDREGFQIEFRVAQPSGDVRVLQTSGRLDMDSSKTRLIGVAQDITEWKESERALADAFSRERLARVGVERANQELEQFVYTVSHDLNSPLISVLGYVDLLEHDYGSVLPEEARFYLERIKTSSDYMQCLIKDLLELSRVGRVQTEPDNVDLDVLIEEITNEIRGRHPDIAVEVKADLPDIRMNPVRARQLFANLLQNSVKYAGRPDVRIRVSAEDGGTGLVTLSVADNGPGIAPCDRERVFGVFERLDNQKEGTGIGLAVCKRIVETSGGRIWIAESGSGTDVRFAVPASNGHGGSS